MQSCRGQTLCSFSKTSLHPSQGVGKGPCTEPTEKVQYVNLINDCTLGRDIGEVNLLHIINTK